MTPADLPRPRGRLRAFLASQAVAGGLLVAAAGVALLFANLPATAAGYAALLDTAVGPAIHPHHGTMTLAAWIGDGLMAFFFLLVGIEVRREFAPGGSLADARTRTLPVLAAAGGMVVPALVYLAVVAGSPGLLRGWAIPTATDIAFAIAVLGLAGPRVPPALRLFLATVAIVDDIGAVAIIALVYTAHLNLAALAGALVVLAAMRWWAGRGAVALAPFVAGFALVWTLTMASGVHPTIAGVATAFVLPRGAPSHRVEAALQPFVALVVLPLFALANAGVTLTGGVTITPLVLAVAAGLFVGKPAGILGAIWLAHRTGLAPRPAAGWAMLAGVAMVAGIGFTMSLFVAALAFPAAPDLIAQARLGIVAGSLAAALAGLAILRVAR